MTPYLGLPWEVVILTPVALHVLAVAVFTAAVYIVYRAAGAPKDR